MQSGDSILPPRVEDPPVSVYENIASCQVAEDERATVEGGFKLFSRRIKMCQKLPTEVQFNSLDDIDFVFIVKRSTGNKLTKKKSFCEHYSVECLERSRLEYLEGLKSEYKIIYKRVEGRTHDFYLIHLSYYHLGLLAEILRYQWQIKTSDPERKVVYTNLSFFRWMNSGKNEEFYNCNDRSNFPARIRLDLAYQFLLEATVRISCPFKLKTHGCCLEDTTEQPERSFFNVMSVLSEKLFDDWMVLHTPMVQKVVKWNFQDCAPFCAALGECFQSTTGDDRPADSSAFNPEKESLREFLCRYCTMKTAFVKHFYPMSKRENVARAELRHIIPVHQIRDYVGEKIGFYFAWAELLVMSMLFPAVIGAVLFIVQACYYTFDSLMANSSLAEGEKLSTGALVQHILVRSCDNYATPIFAILMILWGTIFHELWCRRQAWYSYLWNVESLNVDELEHVRGEPSTTVTTSQQKRCQLRKRYTKYLKYTVSAIVTLFFIGLVFSSVYLINVLHVFSFHYCPTDGHDNLTDINPNTTTEDRPRNGTTDGAVAGSFDTIVLCNLFGMSQATVNSLSISTLNAIYTGIAYKLTDWEDHSTERRYTNALMLKLFVFRFFNYYSVLFFMAFGSNILSLRFLSSLVPGGKPLTGKLGDANSCGNQPCLLKLTKQILTVLVTQRLFTIFMGLVNPWIHLLQELLAEKCKKSARKNEDPVGEEEEGLPMTTPTTVPQTGVSDNVRSELEEQGKMIHLSPLGHQQFTADEFTERMVVFGALLMFSVALPPAAALVLPFIRVDMTMDIRRMVTRYKRPIPHRANGIGVWDKFVNFLTYAAIITNPLVIVLTSTWGSQFDAWSKFWVFIAFEHIAIAARAIVAVAIPDIPAALEREKLRRKIVRHQLLDEAVIGATTGKS